MLQLACKSKIGKPGESRRREATGSTSFLDKTAWLYGNCGLI